ncbi:hypothetical protein ACRARG_05390 [Pseudooceanicola sp. C21-150M6]|uniref:hypothetical protein n=1 Tax=Pseudooceanicola sp. C21-150M6 TaxID=3434355 RepID=UPI003D7FBA64
MSYLLSVQNLQKLNGDRPLMVPWPHRKDFAAEQPQIGRISFVKIARHPFEKILEMLHIKQNSLWMRLLPAILVALALTPAAPSPASAASLLCALFNTCDDDDDEDVEATGVVHVVYGVGGAFMPDRVFAAAGDEVKFYNLSSNGLKVKEKNNDWSSTTLYRNQSYTVMVSGTNDIEFRKSTYGNTSMTGKILMESVPDEFDYGELIDSNGNIIGKDGVVVGVATGLGYTLAAVGGVVQDLVGGLTGGTSGNGNGNGNANGLTNDYGDGNNTN